MDNEWGIPFDVSLLSKYRGKRNLVIRPADDSLRELLMDVLEEKGVQWVTEEKPTKWNGHLSEYPNSIYYCVDRCGYLTYGEYTPDNGRGVLCTFYGEEKDFEPATDDEINSLFT